MAIHLILAGQKGFVTEFHFLLALSFDSKDEGTVANLATNLLS